MDQTEFSRRLLALSASIQTRLPVRAGIGASEIMGRLGYVALVRKAQATLLAVMLVVASVASLRSLGWSSGDYQFIAVLGHALLCLLVVRNFPYRNPPQALKEGLAALSQLKLHDPDSFIARQRTDLKSISNRLLSDLCMQLAMDKRRTHSHER